VSTDRYPLSIVGHGWYWFRLALDDEDDAEL
jgi:hypothetical protein